MKNYANRYMATCAPGLEFVLAGEIADVFKHANNLSQARGKVTFDYTPSDMDVNAVRCADNLYKLYRVFDVGPHKTDLGDIGSSVRDMDFGMGGQSVYRVEVSASRSGRQTYSRYDVAAQIEKSLISTGRFAPGDHINHDLAVRADVADGSCYVYKQLTSAETRFRGGAFQSVPGGIRPSLAHCLVRLNNPEKRDIFYDPFCGAGTIPFERSYYKCGKIFASDYDGGVLGIARQNLGQSAVVFSADAAAMRLKAHSVNKVVTNMPWGRQVKVGDIGGLYRAFFAGLGRILTSDGAAVILTDQVSITEGLCEELGLSCSCIAQLSLHGLHPVVFVIQIEPPTSLRA